MTTSEHDCADYVEELDAERDPVTYSYRVWQKCTVCGHCEVRYDQGGSESVEPIPPNAVFYSDPGWQTP
jgi:hypothetical protein